ncbi:MAG: hypothetical protein WBP10_02495, partial [Thermoanaerobaculia bacterium]
MTPIGSVRLRRPVPSRMSTPWAGDRSELLTLDRMCPNFTYLATISRPEEEPTPWAGESGYIQDLWQRGVLEETSKFRVSPEDTHVFLCGNPSMIVTM